jgi:hypothetical protein
MKRKVLILLTVIGSLLFVWTVTAPAQGKAGTSAAPELNIPVGAKDVGMSGANISSVNGVNSIFWNPAGLDLSQEGTTAMFSYRSWFDDMAVNYLAVSSRFSGLGSLAMTLRTFRIGEIHVTTEDQPDGTGEILDPTFFVFGLTYSKQLTDHVSIGATFNLVNEGWASVSATGVAFDAGVQYQNLGGVQGLSLGVSVKNIGTSMQYTGAGLWVPATDPNTQRGLTYYKVEAASFQMPSTIQIGLGYNKKLNDNSALQISGAFENDNYGTDQYRIGAEYSFLNTFAIRAGYLFSKDQSGTKAIYQNYTLGAGVDLKEMLGVAIAFDYAYAPLEYFTANNLFDVRLAF